MSEQINIVLLPATNWVHSHLIPLFVLNQRYLNRMKDVVSYFVLPEKLHQSYNELGINVLPTDFKDHDNIAEILFQPKIAQGVLDDMLYSLLQSTSNINPDIIIDDGEPLSTFIAKERGVPRISIHRTGYFRSIDPELRNPNHMHSMEKSIYGKTWDASFLLNPLRFKEQIGYNQSSAHVKEMTNYLSVKTKLIPGIASIERLPDDINDRHSYFYTGPLLAKDNPSEKLMNELDFFWNVNKNRKIVFITTGLVDQDNILDVILYLLINQYAVISTRDFEICKRYDMQFKYIPFAPLNHICSKVNLIIHQCGSGIYHYPLLHHKPVITLGTQCYDREDVALRLQQLEVSRHVPSPNDDNNYLKKFAELLRLFEDDKLCNYKELKRLREEIFRTMLDFDAEKMIKFTLNEN